jgi:hypothetical protein
MLHATRALLNETLTRDLHRRITCQPGGGLSAWVAAIADSPLRHFGLTAVRQIA